MGALHNKYEKEIIDYYGVNRDGTDMPTRYMELKRNYEKIDNIILLLFSFSVISSEKENILFENDIYRLSLDSSGNCSKLNLFNKKIRRTYLF